jgi:hypothetical protein
MGTLQTVGLTIKRRSKSHRKVLIRPDIDRNAHNECRWLTKLNYTNRGSDDNHVVCSKTLSGIARHDHARSRSSHPPPGVTLLLTNAGDADDAFW